MAPGTDPCEAPELQRQDASRDSQSCSTPRFACAEGEASFADVCGCGCEPAK